MRSCSRRAGHRVSWRRGCGRLPRGLRLWVERIARPWGDGVDHAWVGEGGEGEGDALPDRVAGARVSLDHRIKRFGPPARSSGVGLEDAYGVGGGGGVECPLVEGAGVAVVEGGGVEKGLDGGAGLAFPEPAVVHPARPESRAGGEAGGTDHCRQRVFAAPYRRPPQTGGQAGCEVLGVEHRHSWSPPETSPTPTSPRCCTARSPPPRASVAPTAPATDRSPGSSPGSSHTPAAR